MATIDHGADGPRLKFAINKMLQTPWPMARMMKASRAGQRIARDLRFSEFTAPILTSNIRLRRFQLIRLLQQGTMRRSFRLQPSYSDLLN